MKEIQAFKNKKLKSEQITTSYATKYITRENKTSKIESREEEERSDNKL